jgi:basic membrane protein A and related proteins
VQDDNFKAGNVVGDVGLAPFHDLESRVSAEAKTRIDQVTAEVVAGRTPTGFTAPTGNCPQG